MYANNWTFLKARDLIDVQHPRDTILYIHKNIDTKTVYPYYYKVELWEKGGSIVDNDPEIASSLYPKLTPSDKSTIINFGRYAPWVNSRYEIYRCTNTGADKILIDVTNRETYRDEGLRNGQEYCYLIRSEGFRNINGVEYRNENWSHVACVTPVDNVPPCQPAFTGETFCDENRRNQINWTYDHSCMYDFKKFLIYFSYDGTDYQNIATIERDKNNPYETNYSYSDENLRVGFYYVAAVDSAENESLKIITPFISNPCTTYELPNVFTPNGDGINDVFQSYYPKDGVPRTVNMQIFNRWGKLVFKTEDPDINWDGRDIGSKRFVPTGVYYYICDLLENWQPPAGPKFTPFSGFIYVYYGKGAQPYVPPIE
jgi:gliding motility-associated-like protein